MEERAEASIASTIGRAPAGLREGYVFEGTIYLSEALPPGTKRLALALREPAKLVKGTRDRCG